MKGLIKLGIYFIVGILLPILTCLPLILAFICVKSGLAILAISFPWLIITLLINIIIISKIADVYK